MNYIFKSERLGFRSWQDSDLPVMTSINMDPRVMQYFPSLMNENQTRQFIEKMKAQHTQKGFCYFAVETLETRQFIGFIGLSEQTFDSPFTPCIDIGWRLMSSAWGHGYATEGALAVLDYGFKQIGISSIKAICPQINTPSENVMKKIGMKKIDTFIHPLLINDSRLKNCVVYELNRPVS